MDVTTKVHRSGERFMAEASALGFRPGEWPLEVTIRGQVFRMSAKHLDRDMDITHVEYRSLDQHVLDVWND